MPTCSVEKCKQTVYCEKCGVCERHAVRGEGTCTDLRADCQRKRSQGKAPQTRAPSAATPRKTRLSGQHEAGRLSEEYGGLLGTPPGMMLPDSEENAEPHLPLSSSDASLVDVRRAFGRSGQLHNVPAQAERERAVNAAGSSSSSSSSSSGADDAAAGDIPGTCAA